MAESDDDTAYPQPTPTPTPDAIAVASAPPKLYDADRNKRLGMVTLEEVQAQFKGKPDALAACIKQDKKHRDQRTWHGLVERASDGVRLRALKQTLQGTKSSTATMIQMTGCSTPTTQVHIHLGDFFPWAAADLKIMMERSQVEVEPAKGVRDFEMPSLAIIIEMGRAAAKRAGCWGGPQVVLITPAHQMVEAADLPKAIGRPETGKPPYPFWLDKGPLPPPWQGFHQFAEVLEPGKGPDPQPAWRLDLLPAETEADTCRGFIARYADGVFAGAADVLDRLKPHVVFVAARPAEDAAAKDADPTQVPLVPVDMTGKTHLTLDDIAARLSMPPGALAECLRSRGYLNLQGEATPAALDVGVTTIVGGGTAFCFDVIKQVLAEPKTDGTEPTTVDKPACQPVEVEPFETGNVVQPASPKPPGEDAEAPKVGPTPRLTIGRSGSGMKTVSVGQQHQPIVNAGTVDHPATGAVPSGPIAVTAPDNRAANQLEAAMQILLTAQETMCRRTPEGGFMAHAGDRLVLQDRMKAAAEALEQVRTMLRSMRQTLERLETENAALQRRGHKHLADDGDRGSDASADVIPFKPAGDPEDSAAAVVSD